MKKVSHRAKSNSENPVTDPGPLNVVQMLRDLAAGLPAGELAERYPQLGSQDGQLALQRAAYILEESRQDTWMLSEIFEHIPEMVFVKETETFTYVRFNEISSRMMQMKREDILGKNDYEIFTSAEAEAFRETDLRVLADGKMVEVAEEIVQTPSGPRYCNTKKLPIYDLDGTPRFLVGIAVDITPMKEAQQEIARTHEQHRLLSAALQQSQERERNRLARELNDELGQVLTGLKIELAWMEDHSRGLGEHITQSQELLDSALASVRRVATALHPQMIEELGLRSALDWLAQDICGRSNSCPLVDCQVKASLSRELAITIFRICQETLLQIAAGGHKLEALAVAESDSGITVRIAASGECNYEGPEAEYLVGVRERVHLWGGSIEHGSDVAKGWELRLSLPLQPT